MYRFECLEELVLDGDTKSMRRKEFVGVELSCPTLRRVTIKTWYSRSVDRLRALLNAICGKKALDVLVLDAEGLSDLEKQQLRERFLRVSGEWLVDCPVTRADESHPM